MARNDIKAAASDQDTDHNLAHHHWNAQPFEAGEDDGNEKGQEHNDQKRNKFVGFHRVDILQGMQWRTLFSKRTINWTVL